MEMLITFKQGFSSMCLKDLYVSMDCSRDAIHKNLPTLIKRGFIEHDTCHNKNDKRYKHYILSIRGFELAELFQKAKNMVEESGIQDY